MDVCNYNEAIGRTTVLKQYRLKTTYRYTTGYLDAKGEEQNSV